jgi:glycine cleavage system H protein
MGAPNDRRYADSHEWHKTEGDLVVLGVTRFAVDQLTDITFAEMKPVGTRIGVGGSVGEIESVKTSSDVYSGVAGEIVAVNPALADNPGLLNSDPFGAGWLVKLRPADRSQLDRLMDATAYEAKNPS